MPFDVEKFQQAKFRPREDEVPVEALAEFFGAGEKPVWRVRGLDSNELWRAMEAGKRNTSVESILKALSDSGDKVKAMRQALGLTADSPGEVVKRLEMLVLGSVQPTIDLEAAVKLARTFPIEFLSITHKISELTGQGADLVKPAAASLQTPSSSHACELPSTEAATSSK